MTVWSVTRLIVIVLMMAPCKLLAPSCLEVQKRVSPLISSVFSRTSTKNESSHLYLKDTWQLLGMPRLFKHSHAAMHEASFAHHDFHFKRHNHLECSHYQHCYHLIPDNFHGQARIFCHKQKRGRTFTPVSVADCVGGKRKSPPRKIIHVFTLYSVRSTLFL